MTALLPLGWAEVTLGDVLCIRNGYAFKSKEFQKHGIPVIRQSNLAGDTVDLSNAVFLPSSYLDEYPQFQIGRGDILIGMSGSIGKLCTYTENFPALQNQRTGKVELPDGYPDLFRYIWYILHTVQDRLTAKGKGVGVQNVSAKDIESLSFWLPPLPEQRRIVAKIEALQERSRKARAALEAIPPLLEQFRQSVLAAAFRGDLTADWRAQHPNVEPASVLLDRIRAERRRRWEEAELAKMQAKGKMPKDEKWKERYKEPEPVDPDLEPEVPETWCVVTVDTVSFVTKLAGFEYTKYVKYDPDGDLAVIKAENGGKHGFRRTEFSRIDSNTVKHLTRSELKGGEVLMVFVGAGVGQVASVPDDQPYFLGPNICFIRNQSAYVLPEFVELFLRSPVGFKLTLSFTKAVAQPSLSMSTIRQIPLVVPPLKEQREIIRRIRANLDMVDSVSEDVERAESSLTELDQSILAKAFRGELVPQDPNDEPASALLERIRAEREAQSTKPRAQKKTPRSTKHTKKAPPVSVNENDDLPLFNSLQK